jgi:hypothetical protein
MTTGEQAAQDETTSRVWVRTVPSLDGTHYTSVLEISDDIACSLNGTVSVRHALAVLDTCARAEYDAAVIRQLGNTPETGVSVVTAIRKTRTIIGWPTRLTLTPVVSSTTGRALVHVRIDGHVVGQWTLDDARAHAVAVLEAQESAELDTAYLLTITASGVDPDYAMRIIDALNAHREDQA